MVNLSDLAGSLLSPNQGAVFKVRTRNDVNAMIYLLRRAFIRFENYSAVSEILQTQSKYGAHNIFLYSLKYALI